MHWLGKTGAPPGKTWSERNHGHTGHALELRLGGRAMERGLGIKGSGSPQEDQSLGVVAHTAWGHTTMKVALCLDRACLAPAYAGPATQLSHLQALLFHVIKSWC
jgi:hypothetical protein